MCFVIAITLASHAVVFFLSMCWITNLPEISPDFSFISIGRIIGRYCALAVDCWLWRRTNWIPVPYRPVIFRHFRDACRDCTLEVLHTWGCVISTEDNFSAKAWLVDELRRARGRWENQQIKIKLLDKTAKRVIMISWERTVSRAIGRITGLSALIVSGISNKRNSSPTMEPIPISGELWTIVKQSCHLTFWWPIDLMKLQ